MLNFFLTLYFLLLFVLFFNIKYDPLITPFFILYIHLFILYFALFSSLAKFSPMCLCVCVFFDGFNTFVYKVSVGKYWDCVERKQKKFTQKSIDLFHRFDELTPPSRQHSFIKMWWIFAAQQFNQKIFFVAFKVLQRDS